MPTEAELREQLHGDDGPGRGIDLDAVLRRSRARRRPRRLAVAAASVLAVAGVVVPVTIGVAAGHPSTLSAGSAASSTSDGSAPGEKAPEVAAEGAAGGGASGGAAIDRAPADKINLGGGALSEPSPAPNGLVLTVQPVDATTASRDIPVTVTLTNTGTRRLVGSTLAGPAITLSRDGIVLWHSNGPAPMIAVSVDLEPGASMRYAASFEPLVCGVADDAGPSFRDGLPPTAPGVYRLSAAIDFTPSDGSGSVLVAGPTASAILH